MTPAAAAALAAARKDSAAPPGTRPEPVRSLGKLLLAMTAAVGLSALAGVTAAQASHWPLFGGDAARSGYQPIGEGRPPVRAVYSKTDETERGVQSSILVSAGQPAVQRMVYGTANGRVHVQVVESGAPVGPEEGIAIDDGDPDADIFTGKGGSVSFVDTSTADARGQLFVVHNDDNSGGSNDLAIAQIDLSTGVLVQDVRIPATRDYTISSSPVASDAAANGDRALFFLANDSTKTTLFRIPIARADTQDATIGATTSREVTGGNPLASPTLVLLNDAAGTLTQYVAVGTSALSGVQTFNASAIEPTPLGTEIGPRSANLGGVAQTPSVPAGAPGAPPTQAPGLYVAVTIDENASVVDRLVQNGNDQVLTTAATSPPLAGAAAPALAVTASKLAVTTSANLHLLDAGSLARKGSLGAEPLQAGAGFGRTTAAVSGGLIHLARDDGRHLTLRLSDGQPLSGGGFRESAANDGATASYGQPAISRGYVRYGSDRGVFVYRSRCGNPISGSRRGDHLMGTSAGDELRSLGGEDSVSGLTGDDCLVGGARADRLEGGAGNDELVGGTGDDRLIDRAGRNRFSGSGGDDRIQAANGRQDRVSCGAGRDLVRADASDRTGRDCERVRTARR